MINKFAQKGFPYDKLNKIIDEVNSYSNINIDNKLYCQQLNLYDGMIMFSKVSPLNIDNNVLVVSDNMYRSFHFDKEIYMKEEYNINTVKNIMIKILDIYVKNFDINYYKKIGKINSYNDFYNFCEHVEDKTLESWGNDINKDLGENKFYNYIMWELCSKILFNSQMFEELGDELNYFKKIITNNSIMLQPTDDTININIVIFNGKNILKILELKPFVQIYKNAIDKLINTNSNDMTIENIANIIRPYWKQYVNSMSKKFLQKRYNKFKLTNETYKEFINRYKNITLESQYINLITESDNLYYTTEA